MADALVKLLNSYGYQPVFLPRTGIRPPELYNFANHRLIRRGPLKNYIVEVARLQLTTGAMASIEGKRTTGKHFKAAIDFLRSALAALGISSVPKLDLSFAGSSELAFSFANVTYESLEPAVLDGVLQELKIPPAIPDSYVQEGALHIAYEYIYSTTLRMSRADGSSFSTDIGGELGSYVDVGASGKVEMLGNSVISFSTADKNGAAFAYKAGRLSHENGVWTFEPEIVTRDFNQDTNRYVPARGVVLRAEDQEAIPE